MNYPPTPISYISLDLKHGAIASYSKLILYFLGKDGWRENAPTYNFKGHVVLYKFSNEEWIGLEIWIS